MKEGDVRMKIGKREKRMEKQVYRIRSEKRMIPVD